MTRRWVTRFLALAFVGSVVLAPPAAADDCFFKNKEDEFVTKFNAKRQNNGRASLPKDLSVARVARHHSVKMKNAGGGPFHSGTNGTHLVTAHLTNWQSLGEIVGKGATVDSLVDAFMNSPDHRSIILDGQWTHIGVGVETNAAGSIYVTGLFVKSGGNPGTTLHAC